MCVGIIGNKLKIKSVNVYKYDCVLLTEMWWLDDFWQKKLIAIKNYIFC